MKHEESIIQRACVKWFSYQFAQYEGLLFAVPNGGSRNPIEAAILKGEGVRRGVADLLLLVPCGHYHGLCIEMKTPKGRLSPYQKDWRESVLEQDYAYAVCRSLDEFQATIKRYLSLTK